jgi:hypothetical protein
MKEKDYTQAVEDKDALRNKPSDEETRYYALAKKDAERKSA